MKNKSGWVSISRNIVNHWLWKDKPFSKGQAWIDLIMMANHKDSKVLFNGEVVEVKRGSLVTSQLKLMERWGWGKTRLRTFLGQLKTELMIELKTNQKQTTITIVNYGVYQLPQTTDQPTAKPLTDQQPNTNNKYNNINNNNNPPTPLREGDGVSFEAFFSAYPKKTEKSKAEKIFKEKNFNQRQFDWVMRVLEEDKRSDQWKRENGRYIPKACNWLENNMYDRELKETPIRIFSTDP